MDYTTLQIERRQHIAWVTLNRPEALNAMNRALVRELRAFFSGLSDDRDTRLVILRGAGRAFCAGLDFGSFMAMAGGERPRRGLMDRSEDSPANFAQQAAFVWKTLPVPVIAAVHGVAFGGGLQIALGADIRLVAPDAQLSVMEVKWGLIPDMSGTQTMRHLVRLDVAKELTFTGRIVSGTEAVQLGLATRTSETPLESAHALAREIAGKSPDAIRAGKRLLDQAWQVSTAEGLRLEEEMQVSLMGSPNQVEAVQANMEKRAPKFR
jgi:enoyl-CoA hydratase/carnithine racemase